jgi:hypothetical protein
VAGPPLTVTERADHIAESQKALQEQQQQRHTHTDTDMQPQVPLKVGQYHCAGDMRTGSSQPRDASMCMLAGVRQEHGMTSLARSPVTMDDQTCIQQQRQQRLQTWLMLTVSLNRTPAAPLRPARSLPARSTR